MTRWAVYAVVAALYVAAWAAPWGDAPAARLAAATALFALFVLLQAHGDALTARVGDAARAAPRLAWRLRASLAAQVMVAALTTWLVPGYATMVLYFIPAVRAFSWLGVREAAAWSLGLAALVVVQHVNSDGAPHGVVVGLTYAGGFALFGATITSLRQAQLDRQRAEALLRDLRQSEARAHDSAARAEERTRELATLLAVSRSVASTLEMEPLMGMILDQLRLVADYTAASVRLVEGDELVMLAYRGPNPRAWERRRMPLALNPLNRVVVERRAAVIVSDAHNEDTALVREYRAAVPWRDPMHAHVRSWLGVPLLARDRATGLIVLNHRTPGHYTRRHAELALALATHAAAAVENARLYEESQRAAAREERGRLARDLHDAVTQTLFSASLIADVLPRLWERDPERGRNRLEELRLLVRGALAEMRTLLLELRPAALAEAPLGELLRHLAEAFTGRTGVPVTLDAETQGEPPAEVRATLYRIAQEALHNVAKHARARRAAVVLRADAHRAELRVEDDGVGFDPAAASATHLGLRIMRERADAIAASVVVRTDRGAGTRIAVTWPASPTAGAAHVTESPAAQPTALAR